MDTVIEQLYRVIRERREHPQEGSYTCYLFEQGLDKILKKIGEESTEVVIAAKDGDNNVTAQEICDLTYHVLVLMVESGIPLDVISEELAMRSAKIGNLKTMKSTNKNT